MTSPDYNNTDTQQSKYFDFEAGEVLLIDKPLGWTSFDVVKKIRNAIGIKKVGHAGTLDPLATGLLIVCTGKTTKQIDHFQAQHKGYSGQLVLGQVTPSYDLETEITQHSSIAHLNEAEVIAIAERFMGRQLQIPPLFSAVKQGGERLYKKARRGEEVEIKAREIEITSLAFTKIDFPVVHFEVCCSKGTYIRSLVRDIGEALGVGAYMSALERTSIGDFQLSKAWQLPELIARIHQQKTLTSQHDSSSGS
jgi:tRNA pseudouridine55 synthase